MSGVTHTNVILRHDTEVVLVAFHQLRGLEGSGCRVYLVHLDPGLTLDILFLDHVAGDRRTTVEFGLVPSDDDVVLLDFCGTNISWW